MVSRRKILSRSRDELHQSADFYPQMMMQEPQDDVWHSKEKLYQVRAHSKQTSINWAMGRYKSHSKNKTMATTSLENRFRPSLALSFPPLSRSSSCHCVSELLLASRPDGGNGLEK